jgi:glycosyltransferase involved in cell wall biosynthesis
MTILVCHAYYQQRGGEDESFKAETSLLESRGHRVVAYVKHNDEVDRIGRARVAGRAVWNLQTFRDVRRLIRRERPSVVHCTNLFPLLSPSVYYAARVEGVPVVQSLPNYRLLCVNSFFFREGGVCQDCLPRSLGWPGVVHGCYRGSRVASAAAVAVAAVQRTAGVWGGAVDRYLVPTEFARQQFIQGGFPPDRIVSKPNFLDPAPRPGTGRGGYVVFAGRLSPEKGIGTLLDAWSRVGGPWRLKVLGDGPELARVIAASHADARIQVLGRRPLADVLSVVGEAACLVMPSLAYETFGRTILEAFAVGTPVVASGIGTTHELVADGVTGLHARVGNAVDFAAKIQTLLEDPARRAAMRRAARAEFERKYTGEHSYRQLMAIYDAVSKPSSTLRAAR